MEKDELQNTASLVARDFELELKDGQFGEEQLLEMLADQIAEMIAYRLEFLLSLMYRLDIDEHKVNHALSPFANDPPNVGLAKLVLERQKRRVRTKMEYKQEEIDGEEWSS